MNVDAESLIDAIQTAKLLKLHPVTVRELAAQGKIPGVKIGRAWRFRRSTLNAWLDEQEGRKS
jgi:excisionase family DNA binding protein